LCHKRINISNAYEIVVLITEQRNFAPLAEEFFGRAGEFLGGAEEFKKAGFHAEKSVRRLARARDRLPQAGSKS
jgi:hypothetical protein